MNQRVPVYKVRVNDDTYRWVHGKHPKGFGQWAFEADGCTFWKYGSFTEARKAACQWAGAMGSREVNVLS